jgi:hypothetical protein
MMKLRESQRQLPKGDMFGKPLVVILREFIVNRKDDLEQSPHMFFPDLRNAILESQEAHVLETGGRVTGYCYRYPNDFKGGWHDEYGTLSG